MNVQRIIQPNYDEGVDRKTLKVICDRFRQVSHGRLQRTHAALNGRQQVVLELLPMLFHVNHPLLPGYVAHQTPYRIQGYQPDKAELAAVNRFSRSFQYRDEPRRVADIQSLFLMGSTGTVAHSERSDMDLRSEEHTSELQSRENLVCRLLLEKEKDRQAALPRPLQQRLPH